MNLAFLFVLVVGSIGSVAQAADWLCVTDIGYVCDKISCARSHSDRAYKIEFSEKKASVEVAGIPLAGKLRDFRVKTSPGAEYVDFSLTHGLPFDTHEYYLSGKIDANGTFRALFDGRTVLVGQCMKRG